MVKTPPDYYKLNWDAAIDQNKGRVGIGVVLRNSDAMVVGTLRFSRPYPRDSHMAEALGLFYASKFCKDIGMTQIIMEGNALQVLQMLKSTLLDLSQLGLIIQEAKRILNSFAKWSCYHVKREGNQATHLLDKDALTFNYDLYTFDQFQDVLGM